jgi:hypothetical protein
VVGVLAARGRSRDPADQLHGLRHSRRQELIVHGRRVEQVPRTGGSFAPASGGSVWAARKSKKFPLPWVLRRADLPRGTINDPELPISQQPRVRDVGGRANGVAPGAAPIDP